MFTKIKNKMAGNTFAMSCIAFIVVLLVCGFFFFGCSGIKLQSPIKVNVNAEKALYRAAASSLGYLIGKNNPEEARAALLVADLMLGENEPLQGIVNVVVEELREAVIKDEYLALQCEQLLKDLDIEISTDGLIMIDSGNELIKDAFSAFLDGLRGSEGVS